MSLFDGSLFEGKTMLVTGAASGIGAAVVGAASSAGALVWGLDVNTAAGPAVASNGGVFRQCDVSSESDWAQIAADVEGNLSGIDYLHLNAGIQSAPPDAPLSDYRFAGFRLERYRQMMGVNVDGVVLGLHYLLPYMNAGGSIVVTGSLAGLVPYDVDPLYAMSKHAITGLVRSLGREVAAAGLRINAICPGGIDTGIIPNAQRTEQAVFMTPAHVALEVLQLFLTTENGETWTKVAEGKPARVMSPPGRKPRGDQT